MNNLSSYQPDQYRAVSMDLAPSQGEDGVKLCLRMDNGQAITVMCSAESLLSVQSGLRHCLSKIPLAANHSSADDEADFNDNAAGS